MIVKNKNDDAEEAKTKHPKKKKVYLLIAAISLFVMVVFLPSIVLNLQTKSQRFQFDDVPYRRVGIVFGAGVWQDGTPTPYLQDRLEMALRLYRAGKINTILLSGDNGAEYHDEPTVMKSFMVKNGVPESALVRDFAGFSTYDTCYRAHEIFGLSEATLITHGYHLPRAIKTCNSLGVNSIGVDVSWGSAYTKFKLNYITRELFSTDKALIQIYITQPAPIKLGEKISI